jgi:hypothetical protein
VAKEIGLLFSVLASHHCNKIPELINLKGEKIYFGLRFQSMVSWPCCFWIFDKEGHHSGDCSGQAKLFTSWRPGS